MLDTRRADGILDGVVLLDLPDHDSTEVSTTSRSTGWWPWRDLLVWVLDPVKYADARDPRPLPRACVEHPRRGRGRCSTTSTPCRRSAASRCSTTSPAARRRRPGEGAGDRDQRPPGHRSRRAARRDRPPGRREEDDPHPHRGRHPRPPAASTRRAAVAPSGRCPPSVRRRSSRRWARPPACPTIVEAVERSTRIRAVRATGWPVVSWISGLRGDPLKKLQLDLGDSAGHLSGSATAAPTSVSVQRARVDTEVRTLADDASEGLGAPWAAAVQRAAVSRIPELGDRLDSTLAATDLGRNRLPGWVGLVRVLQWLLLLGAIGCGRVGGARRHRRHGCRTRGRRLRRTSRGCRGLPGGRHRAGPGLPRSGRRRGARACRGGPHAPGGLDLARSPPSLVVRPVEQGWRRTPSRARSRPGAAVAGRRGQARAACRPGALLRCRPQAAGPIAVGCRRARAVGGAPTAATWRPRPRRAP